MLRHNWKRKNSDDPEEPREIKDIEKARRRTFDRAIRLLTFKWRSIAELRERLLEKNWTNEEIVDYVIAKLEEYGYLNDEQFAKDFAASKIRQKPQGKRILQQKLMLKKVSKETADAALEKVFEETPEAGLVEQAIKKRIRLKGKPETREDAKKFYDFLLRQGFSYDLVSSKMREISSKDFESE
ncbi:MAG TPA: RecX family transcriptional regulator [Pyrinomonadaceae bacterium]|jgi:regulatory protein